jgi:type VI secretion system protein ImpJ
MKLLSKVVWSEGMYLSPHHFQTQNRYSEDSLRTVTETLWFEPYGLAGCTLDPEAVRNGTVVMIHARGIMPDGLCFNAPESDPLPQPMAIADLFPPAADHIIIYLTVPARKNGGSNCAMPGEPANSHRYVAEERELRDANTGGDGRTILIGRKNLSLDTNEGQNRTTLPIARVIRDGAKGFLYDPEFVPPLLKISANEGLMLRLRRLIEILDEKSASLALRAVGPARDFSTGEIASYWLRHAINSAVVVLRHLWISKRAHPEELFLEMSRLAGALCTFGLDSHPRSLPAYDHENLTKCLSTLDRHIREHLEILMPTNCISISLTPGAPYFFEGKVTDSRALGRAQWILGIRANIGESALISLPPQLVKFCSTRFVGELVKRALPGLRLTHLSSPPPAVPRKVEMQYFGITKTGPCWDHIVETQEVGVYVPGELPDAELELLVVLEA